MVMACSEKRSPGIISEKRGIADIRGGNIKQTKSIVAIKPKPPFRPIFQVAASRKGSNIRILNEPLEGSALFLVETGESRTPRPKEAAQNILQA